ncbi:MAG: alpha/beta hydrolase [Phycicoccus sp.]
MLTRALVDVVAFGAGKIGAGYSTTVRRRLATEPDEGLRISDFSAYVLLNMFNSAGGSLVFPHPSLTPRRVAGVVLGAVLVVSTGAIAPGARAASDVGAPLGPRAGAGPATTTSTLAWAPCGDRLECATLTVPLNHSRPDSRTIDLAVVRRPAADPARRLGALVTNPGGPGSSGFDFVADNPDRFPAAVTDRYDVVGFDPRGVGRSAPVRCLEDSRRVGFFDTFAAAPVAFSQWVDLARQSASFATQCGQRSADLLPFVDTASTARDLDLLRAALGEDQLDYIGYSYGTYLGATYAALYPKRVGSFVLDGAVNPTVYRDDPFAEARVQAETIESALQRFYAACAANESCGLGPDPQRAVEQLLASLDERPLTVRTELGTRKVTRGSVGIAVYVALIGGTDSWPAIAAALQQAREGDGSGILQFADAVLGARPDGSFDNEYDARTATVCADKRYPRDVLAWKRLATHLNASGTFGSTAVSNYVACAFWPTTTANPYAGSFDAPGSNPIVVIGTTGDTATPYEGAVAMADTLDAGVLLTHRGEGHTIYGAGNECVDALVNAYLVDGTAPAGGTTCTT